MIFKAITDQTTGALKSVTIFGSTLFTMIKNLRSGQGIAYSLFNGNVIKPKETQNILNYFNAIQSGTNHSDAFAEHMKGCSVAAQNYAKEARKAGKSTTEVAAELRELPKVSKAGQIALKGLAAAGNMLIFALISKGIQAAMDAIDRYVHRAEYAAQALKEAQQEISESQSNLRSMSATLAENQDRFLELSNGVDKFSKNLSLSTEDYAEYLSISNELAELFPSLISGYDSQGNALLAIGSDADETREKLQQLLETEQNAARQTLIDEMDDLASGVYSEVDTSKDSISGMKRELKNRQEQYKDLSVILNDSAGSISFASFNSDDANKYVQAMADALNSAGAKFYTEDDKIWLSVATTEQLAEAQKIFDASVEADKAHIEASLRGLEQGIQSKSDSIKISYSKMNASLQAWVADNADYQYLSDQSSALVDAIIPNIDWSDVDQPLVSAEDYQNYVQKNILDPLMKVPKENRQEIEEMFQQLLSYEDGDRAVLPFADTLQKRLDELDITIDITPIIADEKAQTFGTVIAHMADELGIIAQNEPLSFTDSLSGVESLSNGLEQLGRIYADVLDGGAFDWSSILNNEDFKNTFGSFTDEYDQFIQTIANHPDDINACQEAFDGLVSAYIQGSGSLTDLTDETKNSAIALLEQMGIANADEFVTDTLTQARIEAVLASFNFKNSSMSLKDAMLQETDVLGLTEEETANLANAYSNAQSYMVSALNNGANERLKKLGSELSAIRSYSDALNVLSGKYGYTDSWRYYADGYFESDQQWMRDILDYGKSLDNAQAILDTALNTQAQYTGLYSPSGNSQDSSNNAKETAETFNWLETLLTRIQRKVTNFGKTVSAVWQNWTTRGSAAVQQLAAIREELTAQQQAYDAYLAKADSVGLSGYYQDLVKNGSINIEDITDDGLKEQIKAFQEWYDKALAASDSIADLKDNLAELARTRFDNVSKEFEGKLSLIEHETDLINSRLEQTEAKGYLVSGSYYDALIAQKGDMQKNSKKTTKISLHPLIFPLFRPHTSAKFILHWRGQTLNLNLYNCMINKPDNIRPCHGSFII